MATTHRKEFAVELQYFDKKSLIKANNEAIRKKRNRAIKPSVLKKLDDETKFPVVFSMTHNDREVRVKLLLNPQTEAWLDVSFKTFCSLPTVTMPTA